MNDIVTHRVRIGIFNIKVKNYLPVKKSTQSPSTRTNCKMLLAFLLVFSWLVTISTETYPRPVMPSYCIALCPNPGPAHSPPLCAAHLEQVSEPVGTHSLSRKQQNKLAHSLCGNRQVGIKLAHWNAGEGLWKGKCLKLSP